MNSLNSIGPSMRSSLIPATLSALALWSLAGQRRSVQFEGPGAGDASGAGGTGGAGGGESGKGEGGEGDPATATIPKSQYDAVLNETIARRKELAEMKKQLDALRANAPAQAELEELRQYRVKQQQEAEEKAKKDGQLEKLLEATKAKHAEEVAGLRNTIEGLKRQLNGERVQNLIASTVPQYTAVPVEDVSPLLIGQLEVADEATGTVKPKGDPLGENGKPMTAAEFIAAYITKRPHLAAVKPKGGSGSDTTTGGKGGRPKDHPTDAQIARMTDAEFAAYERDFLGMPGKK